MSLDRTLGDEESPADLRVREALGDEGENLALAVGEVVQRVGGPPAREEPRDDGRIDDSLALRQSSERIDEDRGIADRSFSR